MINTVAFCASAIVLAGCSMPTLKQDDIAALRGKRVLLVTSPKANMALVTPAAVPKAVIGGVLGAALGGAQDSRAVPPDWPDPALAVAAGLAEELSLRYGTVTVMPVQPGSAATASQPPLSDYTLYTSTVNVMMSFYFSAPSRYRISYATMANIVDNKTRQSVAQGVCVHSPDDSANAATFDEMIANNGERVKREMAAGADMCTRKLKQDMFSHVK